MIITCLSCAWLLGVFLGYYFHLPWLFCLAGIVPLLFLFISPGHKKALISAALGIVLLVTGASHTFNSLYSIDAGMLRFYNDLGKIEITGSVITAPDVRDKYAQLTVAANAIELDGIRHDVAGRMLVFVPRYPAYHYGDVLRIDGELATPPRVDDFDYAGYLSHQGIYSTVYYPDVTVVETEQGFAPLAWIYSLREHLSRVLTQVLPEPQAALAQGMLLGIRTNIPADLNQDFSRSGAIHLLAISGLHVGIMAGIMLGVGLWLFGRRRYLYVWLALGAVWLYAILTGLNPPVLRSAIMATLFLVAEALGRQRSAMVALTLAAAVMTGISPYILGDASFQLSFLAMAGLVFIFPALSALGRRVVAASLGESGLAVTSANAVVDIFSAALGATIAVWPVIAYYFGMFSLVGPLATFLLVPVLPVIVLLGTLTVGLGLVSLAIARVFGWLVWPFLSYMILVVNGLGSPSLASVDTGSVSPLFIAGYYVSLAAVIWWYRRWQRWRELVSGSAGIMKSGINFSFGISGSIKWAVLPLLLLALLVSYTAATLPDDDLHVSFLDVGQGDAILIRKGSQQILIDGGPSPREIMLALGRQMPFWDRTINLLVLTHPHQDHLGGLLEVLRRYQVNQVLYPNIAYSSSLLAEWTRAVEEKGIENIFTGAGQRIILDGNVYLDVLSPGADAPEEITADIDMGEIVLRLQYGSVSFLLTADTVRDVEWDLVRQRAPLGSTVLKVAHHGSATSTSFEFLGVVSPAVAVISVGAANSFGLPDQEVLDKLDIKPGEDRIYRTDERGTITFRSDGEKLWVSTEKD
jgi:competence protein ComEC